MATTKDFYNILGVSRNATDSEIKSAYRRLALKWHPDKHKGEAKKKAEQKFKEVNQAYEVLKDPQKRKMYDQFGHAAFTSGQTGAGGPFSGGFQKGPFHYTYTTGGSINFEDLFGGSDPFDIFEQFFGSSSPFRSRQNQRPIYSITLDFMEAVKGVEKSFVIQGSQRKIKIPAGVHDNSRIRFSNFDVVIRVKPHDIFKRQGNDIFVDKKIPLTTAILGGVVDVPTIDGVFKLKVRAGTQSGTLIRLRGKGVSSPHSHRSGDQYVRLIVEIPTKITKKQRDLLKEFEKISND